MNPVTIASLKDVLNTAKRDAQKPHRTMKGVISWLAAELTAFQQQAPADRFMISCIQDRACEDWRFKRDFIAQLETEIDALQHTTPEPDDDADTTKQAAEQYFSRFRNNVNTSQLTRFENYVYKNLSEDEPTIFGSLMLWATCELIARNMDNNGGLAC